MSAPIPSPAKRALAIAVIMPVAITAACCGAMFALRASEQVSPVVLVGAGVALIVAAFAVPHLAARRLASDLGPWVRDLACRGAEAGSPLSDEQMKHLVRTIEYPNGAMAYIFLVLTGYGEPGHFRAYFEQGSGWLPVLALTALVVAIAVNACLLRRKLRSQG